MLRWQQAEGRRHALDGEGQPQPGVEFWTLCGVQVTPERADCHSHGGKWLDPTCELCDHTWREMAHFPPNEIPALP
jgi:hypothetical protein